MNPKDIRISGVVLGRGVRREEIIETINHPDEKETLSFIGKQMEIFLKKINNRFLLVLAVYMSRKYFVHREFPLFEDFMSEIKTTKPLTVLEKFCQRFGLLMRLHGKEAFLFQKIEFKYSLGIPRSFGGITILNPENHRYREYIWDCDIVKISPGISLHKYGLYFVIDLDKYDSWVSSEIKGNEQESQTTAPRSDVIKERIQEEVHKDRLREKIPNSTFRLEHVVSAIINNYPFAAVIKISIDQMKVIMYHVLMKRRDLIYTDRLVNHLIKLNISYDYKRTGMILKSFVDAGLL